jgi:general secretion pathway protein B
MSYLLDALRKSEAERLKNQKRPARAGFTFIRDEAPSRKSKNILGLILTSVMLVIALILGAGWWWSQNDTAVSDVSATAEPTTAPGTDTVKDNSPPPVPVQKTIPRPPSVVAEKPQVEPPARPPAEIPYLAEMSLDFQQKIPRLQFSGHVYSPEPSLRLIMINDAIIREGGLIEAELMLEEITTDGVVISLSGARFQVKLF